MISEGIHERLLEVYDEFDRHSRLTNTQYSIDADEYNLQAYRILKCIDFARFLRHICNFIKDKQINLDVDDKSVTYDDLNNPKFTIPKREQPLLVFTLKSIQERGMLGEEQFKSPTKKHTLQQSQFPSSKRKHKTPFTYEGGKGKRRFKKDFGERLDEAINEEMGIQFTTPEVLFTQVQSPSALRDPAEIIKNLRNAHTTMLRSCVDVLATADDSIADVIATIMDGCNHNIQALDGALGRSVAEETIKEFNFINRPPVDRSKPGDNKILQLIVSELMATGIDQRGLAAVRQTGSANTSLGLQLTFQTDSDPVVLTLVQESMNGQQYISVNINKADRHVSGQFSLADIGDLADPEGARKDAIQWMTGIIRRWGA